MAKTNNMDYNKKIDEILKNPVMKEQVYRNTTTPIAVNGYVQTHSGSESETTTKGVE